MLSVKEDMNGQPVTGRDPKYSGHQSGGVALRRVGFAAITLVCLVFSIWLIYSATLLHFAAGSSVFLRVPDFDPRPHGHSEEIGLLLLQIIGGFALTICFASENHIARMLKWWPLFVIAFAALTWVAALAIGPWHVL